MTDDSQQSSICLAVFLGPVMCWLPKGHDGNHQSSYLNALPVRWADHVSEGHDHTS